MRTTVSFGYWIKRRRKALDLTQKNLAQQVGCAMVTIKKIEADERRPSRQMAERLAECLAIPSEQRTLFKHCARGELSIDRLPFAREPIAGSLSQQMESSTPAFINNNEDSIPYEIEQIVGHERELIQLEDHLQNAISGNGGIVFVTGEAGRGKTALMAEFSRRAQKRQVGLLVAAGNCNAYSGVGDPFLPFRDVMEMLSGDVEARWVARKITSDHARALWDIMPQTVQALMETGPDLIDLFGLGDTLSRRVNARMKSHSDVLYRLQQIREKSQSANYGFEQRQVFEQYTQLLRRLAVRQPLLLLLDDLQWADSASIDLLFHLGRRLPGSRILILGAYRSSDVALGFASKGSRTTQIHPLAPVIKEFRRRYGDIEINLEQLTMDDGRDFVDKFLNLEANQFSNDFRSSLFALTKGHPLFTVELVRSLKNQGTLVYNEDEEWVEAGRLNWESLPARVEAVIEQRIERLEDQELEILTVASVEGGAFTAQVLSRVMNMNEQELVHLLSQELEGRHSLVREREEISLDSLRLARFEFSHILFQDYLYSRLGGAERRQIHRKVAMALEDLYKGKESEISIQIAHHYILAGDRLKSIEYSLIAARQSKAFHGYEESIRHFMKVIELVEPGEMLAAHIVALEEMADVHMLLGEHPKSIRRYQEALDIWHSMKDGDKWDAVRLHRKIIDVVIEMILYSDRQRFEKVVQASIKATLQFTEGEPPHPELIHLLVTLSMNAQRLTIPPDWDTAENYARAAITQAEELDLPVELSFALDALSSVYGGRGLFLERVELSFRRLALADDPRFQDARERAKILQQVGAALVQVGEYSRALPHLLEAESLSNQVQALVQQIKALIELARCWFRLDRWDQMLEVENRFRNLEQRYSNFPERTGAFGSACFLIALSSCVHALRGSEGQALELSEESSSIVSATAGSPEDWRRSHHY